MTQAIITRMLGSTGYEVTAVGLGGQGILRTYGEEGAAAVIREAIGAGITSFDFALVYKGSEDYYGRVWSENPQPRP